MPIRVVPLPLLLLCCASPLGLAAESPSCSVVAGAEGGPAIVIDGNPYSPLMFVGNNQFDKDDILLEQLRLAAEAGIDLFCFLVRLDWHWTAEHNAEVIDRFCSAHPDGYFYLRIWLGPNQQWMKEHPDECIAKADGTRLNWVSPASVPWREATAAMLRKRVREVIDGPHGDRFIGVCFNNMQTGEWFYRFTNEFMDYSPANLSAFRSWLKEKYRRDKRLQQAWHDSAVTLDTATFPDPALRDQGAWGPFRDPKLHQPAIDMQRFQNELVADTIAYFAATVKEATARRALVGTFYGYTMELNNNGPRALAHSGHLALARLLDCPDIDLIHAPYSYFERATGQPGHLHLPADTLALHGKLGMFEEDTYTHLGEAPKEGVIAPGWRERTTSIEQTLAVTRRNFANFFTHRCGLWFFDLLSDGRWNDPKFWETAPLLRRMAAELRGEPPFEPEVAVAIDETSVHLMRATTHPYLQHALAHWRSELDRLGTPVGYYLQSDLPHLPDSVKVLILPNAFRLSQEEERAVERHLKQGNTVVWTYAPDLFGPDGPDPARIARRVGMPVEARFDDVPMHIVSEPTGEKMRISPKSWQPRFVVAVEPASEALLSVPPNLSDPSDPTDRSDPAERPPSRKPFWANLKDKLRQRQSPKTAAPSETPSPSSLEILARYESTNEIAAAARPFNGGVSVYTATPRLPAGLLRYICQNSSVHLYHDVPGMTGLLGKYLVVHTPDGPSPEKPTQYTFHWPSICERVTRITPSPAGIIAMETDTWTDTLNPKTTAIYRCE